MPFKVASAIILLVVAGYLVIPFLTPLATTSHSLRVNDASEGLGCTTATAATTCAVTLANAHAHGDTSHMTITETSPGATTRSGALALTDRTALTVSGLAAVTVYTFTVAYEVVDTDVDSDFGELMRLWPLLVFVVLGIVVFMAQRMLRSGGGA